MTAFLTLVGFIEDMRVFFKRMWRTNRWLLYTRGPKFRHRQILFWEVHRWSEEPWSKQMQLSWKSRSYVQCRCRRELQAEGTVGVTAHSEGWRRLKGTVMPKAREEGQQQKGACLRVWNIGPTEVNSKTHWPLGLEFPPRSLIEGLITFVLYSWGARMAAGVNKSL